MIGYGIPAAFLILGLPGTLQAQHGPDKCGTAANPQAELATFAQALTAPFQVVANNVVRTLQPMAPDETTQVMTDQHACQRVLNAGLKQLRDAGQMKGFQPTGFQHRTYRLGPYYMIAFSDAPPNDVTKPNAVINLSPEFLLFFDVETLEFLGEVMQPG